MPDPFAAKGGGKPASPRGARSRSEARVEGERAKGQTTESPDDENLTGKQRSGESVMVGAFELMNETLKRLHKMPPKQHKPSGGES